jgi:hypothetical protein
MARQASDAGLRRAAHAVGMGVRLRLARLMVGGEKAYLEKAIGRYAPPVAATARAGLKKLRARFPGARLVVYERRQSLPIGFAPAQGGSAVFSLVLYPRWVRFFFLEGVALDDPEGRLEGSGSQVRSIRVDSRAAILDDPYVRRLMAQALKLAGANLKVGGGEVVVKSKIAVSTMSPPRG